LHSEWRRYGLVQSARSPSNAVDTGDASGWLDLIPSSDAAVDRDKVTVTYAVIANSTAPGVERLPFFSRVNLMQTARSLRQMGFTKIALARVPVETASSGD